MSAATADGLFVEDGPSLPLWTASAVAVGVLHLALVAAMLFSPPAVRSPEPPSAALIELAQPADAPPAQQLAETSAESPSQPQDMEKPADAEKTPEPETVVADPPPEPVPQLPVLPQANAVLPTVAPPPKPPDAKPAPEKKVEKPVRKPVTTEAKPAKPPSHGAPSAAASSTAGTGISSGASSASWKSSLLALLNRNKRYPAAARERREQGRASLSFTMDRGGNVLSSRIVQSTGSSALDQEAIDMLRRSSPLPAPPPEVGGSRINLTVPVRFNVD